MIKLNVIEDYCQECPYFIPDVVSDYPNIYDDDEAAIRADIAIVCEHYTICDRLARWIKQNEFKKIVHDYPGGIHE